MRPRETMAWEGGSGSIRARLTLEVAIDASDSSRRRFPFCGSLAGVGHHADEFRLQVRRGRSGAWVGLDARPRLLSHLCTDQVVVT